MIPVHTFIFLALALILSCVLPVVLICVWCKKHSGTFLCVMMGAFAFYVPQMLIRNPIMKISAVQNFLNSTPVWVSTLILALSAALLESLGRFIILDSFMRKKRDFNSCFAAGLGHGTIEAAVLVAASYISYLVFACSINIRGYDAFVESMNDPEGCSILLYVLRHDSSSFLLGGLERFFTIGFQIFLTVCFGYFMQQNKTVAGFFIVMGIHTFVDFIVPYVSVLTDNQLLAEGLMGVIFAVSVFLLVRLSKKSFEQVYD